MLETDKSEYKQGCHNSNKGNPVNKGNWENMGKKHKWHKLFVQWSNSDVMVECMSEATVI